LARARYAIAFLIALSFATAPVASPVRPGTSRAEALRPVSAGRVQALVPNGWEVQLIGSSTAHRIGFKASTSLAEWRATKGRSQGLEAYWVDAADVGVPSDYYYLAARGPASRRLAAKGDCHSTGRRVLLDDRPRFDRRVDSPGNYVAMATGTCRSRENKTRWASFVAAPGFGPVRQLGIPESGLYYVLVVVDEGPRANDRIGRLLQSVSFGGTPVADFLRVAATGGQR
jgi:hypothetical protein